MNIQNSSSGLFPPQPVVPYSNPAGTDYPIMAYNNVPLIIEQTLTKNLDELKSDYEAYLNTVKDCGFNVNIWISGITGSTIKKYRELLNIYFQAAENVGLKTILNLSGKVPFINKKGTVLASKESLTNVLELYHSNENLWGYQLMEEPQYYNWHLITDGNTVETIDTLMGRANCLLAYKLYTEHHNNKPAYINLAVSTDKNWTGVAPGNNDTVFTLKSRYFNYLKEIYATFPMSALSVDIYPIRVLNNKLPAILIDQYYYSLEAIGEFSSQFNIPCWLILLSNQHILFDDEGKLSCFFPSPTAGSLRFQAMTALAHGIKGLTFWTYGMPMNKWHDTDRTLNSEVYLNAPYVNYRKTKIWDYCKTVIDEIKFYGKELLNTEFIGARHVYNTNEPDDIIEKLGITLFSPIRPFGCISSATADKKGYVITHLNGPLFDYMAIVSHDWEEEQRITVHIAPGYSWMVMKKEDDSHDNNPENLKTGANSVTYILKPGGMLLIRYRTGFAPQPI